MLYENPDAIIYNDKEIRYHQLGTYPFGYYKGKLIIGKETESHIQMLDRKYQERSLAHIKYSGRLYTKEKIITFWDYPPENKIGKILKDIYMAAKETFTKIGSLTTYKIEIITKPNGEIIKNLDSDNAPIMSDLKRLGFNVFYIPVSKYKGSMSYNSLDRERHIQSPLNKTKSVVHQGIGSKKPVPGAIKGEIPAQTWFRMKKGLGDGIIKLKYIVEKIMKGQ